MCKRVYAGSRWPTSHFLCRVTHWVVEAAIANGKLSKEQLLGNALHRAARPLIAEGLADCSDHPDNKYSNRRRSANTILRWARMK